MAETSKTGVSEEMRKKILEVVRKPSRPETLKWTEDESKVKIEQIRNGSLDDFFRVYQDNVDSNSVLVKQFKSYGVEDQQSQDRGEVEVKALEKFASLVPGSVVKPLYYDKHSKLLCLEDLRDYSINRSSLIDGHIDDDAALKLARDIAVIHRDTHVAKVSENAIQDLDAQFKNANTLANRAHFLFTAPFSKDDPTNQCSDAVKAKLDWLYGDPEVLQAASNMKKVFLEKKEALVHGDLHTGSVMVKDEDSRLMNAEFTYVGPCSLDVGLLIANYIFTYYCHTLCPHDNDNHRIFAYKVVEISNQTVDEYFQHMTSMTEDSDTYQAKFLSEVAGFAGCEIIRRLVGAHHVAEFQHTDNAEVDTLGAGVRLLKAYHRIHSVGTLMLIALMLA